MQEPYQFMCILGYGRIARKGAEKWECVDGITREGARSGGACNHVRDRRDAVILHGISPLGAGRLALERAAKARDHGHRARKLRRDGHALFAGVASYPVPREVVDSNAAKRATYFSWRDQTLDWLIGQFGEHLKSVVEHVDERQYHIHFYIVPALGADDRLNVPEIHPGYRMKYDAHQAGACKKDQDAAYRSGMSRWQDEYWWDVSRAFRHTRLGPKRMRLNRRQYLHERKLQEEKKLHHAELNTAREQNEHGAAQRRTEQDRHHARRLAALERREADFTASFGRVKAVVNEERARRRKLEVEVDILRARLIELEPAAARPDL